MKTRWIAALIVSSGCMGHLGPTIAWKKASEPRWGWQGSGGIPFAQLAAAQTFDAEGAFTYGALQLGAWLPLTGNVTAEDMGGTWGLGNVHAMVGGGGGGAGGGVILGLAAGGAAGGQMKANEDDDSKHVYGAGVVLGIRIRAGSRGNQAEVYVHPQLMYAYVPDLGGE